MLKEHNATIAQLIEDSAYHKRLMEDAKRDVEKQKRLIEEVTNDSLKTKQANSATFSKMQEYINHQTEYINSAISSKDDTLENFGKNIQMLLKRVANIPANGMIPEEQNIEDQQQMQTVQNSNTGPQAEQAFQVIKKVESELQSVKSMAI